MQTLSSPISRKSKLGDPEPDFLPEIAQSSALKTALSGLDASLNDELDRYRHWQDNGQTISYLNPFRPRAVSTQSIWTSPSLSEALYPAIASPVESQGDHRKIQMPVMPPMGTGEGLSASISAAELHRYRGLEDLQNLENEIADERLDYAQDMNGYGEATLAGDRPNSPKMAPLPQPDDDDILQSFANDYAEQYQEAANQDFAPIPNATNERSALRSLMNPVGIISLLLLLFSSAAIGYLMVDPSGVMKLFKPEATPKTSQDQAPETSPTAELGSQLNLSQGKNIDDSVSFVPFAKDKKTSALTIEDLITDKPALGRADSSLTKPRSLANIPAPRQSSLFAPSPSFVPAAPLRTVPTAALPPISVSPIAPAIAPVERSYSPPPAPVQRSYEEPAPARSSSPPARRTAAAEPVRVTRSAAPVAPKPRPAAVAPTFAAARSNAPQVKYAAPLTAAPAPVSSAPAASSYRVVVEGSYAASAQQVEREAYVRPSDGQVQMGAYRDPSVAQQRIEELRRQGIPARME
ncbi:MAG: hypothetical protein AUK48_13695 [Oscillatoriales cyanobacterium CG2_30_44_21]|nr:MAG: hypothetical protein AUK48_13695 [Oscillatoriales cyanobacterium CG2_30_44_21]